MSYYDIDAILTDSQKLPCTFQLDVPGLGYLDGNAGGTVSIVLSSQDTRAEILSAGQSWDDYRAADVVGSNACCVNWVSYYDSCFTPTATIYGRPSTAMLAVSIM